LVERGEATHDPDERFLRGVVGVARGPRDPPADRVDTVDVPAEQLVECRAVARLGGRDEFTIVEG
jgi:hypothetical protein